MKSTVFPADPRQHSGDVQEDAGDPKLRDNRPQDSDTRLSTPKGPVLVFHKQIRGSFTSEV